MKLKSQDLPAILRENDNFYLEFIKDSISHADPEATLTVRQNTEGLNFVVSPSIDLLRQSLIDNLLAAHRRLNLSIRFSSSLKIQKSVIFSVKFNKIR